MGKITCNARSHVNLRTFSDFESERLNSLKILFNTFTTITLLPHLFTLLMLMESLRKILTVLPVRRPQSLAAPWRC